MDIELFQPVKGTRISEEIAEQVRTMLLSGELRPNDRLPSESELARMFQASRSSVREALRSLETAGFIVVKRGAQGGAYVSASSLERTGEQLSDALRLGGAPIAELTEARLLLEPALARLAAERADEEDLERIKETIDEVGNRLDAGENPVLGNLAFHRAVAKSSKNSILILTLNSSFDVLSGLVGKLHIKKEFVSQILSSHRKIYRALENHDSRKAFETMEKHIREVHDKLSRACLL